MFTPVDGIYIACGRTRTRRSASPASTVALGVADRAALDLWVGHLDELGLDHSPIIDATIGWMIVFQVPDGIGHHLYTMTDHGIDHAGEAGYGQMDERALTEVD